MHRNATSTLRSSSICPVNTEPGAERSRGAGGRMGRKAVDVKATGGDDMVEEDKRSKKNERSADIHFRRSSSDGVDPTSSSRQLLR
jgi:hypothetical protein